MTEYRTIIKTEKLFPSDTVTLNQLAIDSDVSVPTIAKIFYTVKLININSDGSIDIQITELQDLSIIT